jgi:putative ABC transport system substrate-binding protein
MMVLSRRQWLRWGGAAGVTLLTGGLPALAATPERTFRIHMVLGRGEGANEAGFKDFLARRGLRAEYTIHDGGGDPARIAAIVEELRAARPDLIYTWGTPQTRGVVGAWDDPEPERYIRDIPVLFTYVAAPLDARIVPDLERPGSNVSGTIHIAPIVAQVNTILAYRPIKRLGVVFNPAERNSFLAVEGLRQEWGKRGLTLIEQPLPLTEGKPDPADIPAMIARCRDQGAEMLYIGPDTFIATTHRKLVAETALALRLPSFSVTELIVRSDQALFALSSSSYGIGRLTGVKAVQILLEGRSPGDLPVETLRRFSVVINMATAKALSFYPPLSLLNFAEVVGV